MDEATVLSQEQQITYTISRDTINQIQSWVNNIYETCANFTISDIELIIDGESTINGPNVNEVCESGGTCQHEYYSNVILHTHPSICKAYPSAMDISKVMKNANIIQSSLIATKWGMWIISNDYTRTNLYNESKRDQLHEVLNFYLNIINKYTSNKKGGSINLPPIYAQLFKDPLQKIMENTNLIITFFPWSSIENGMTLSLYNKLPQITYLYNVHGMTGGYKKISCYQKYIKYKTKYLELKKFL